MLPASERQKAIDGLSPEEAVALLHDWRFWARPKQLPPPGDWRTWLILAGRGFGKSRTGAEWVRGEVEAKRAGRIALIARTAADVRDVIVEGESGILAISPPWDRPRYEPSKRRLTWDSTGAIATTYTADEPDALRGPQHDRYWADEIASWPHPDEAWSNLAFGLRLGTDPKGIATTTPRPIALIRTLLKDPTTAVTRGSTYENRANLPQAFFDQVISKYEGTRLGRQELLGDVLDDTPGALWQRSALDEHRVQKAPDLGRIIVAIDPATTSDEKSDETGIIVVGKGVDGHGYVLADRSCRMSPEGWGKRAVIAYDEFAASLIVGEANNGGDMIEMVVRAQRKGVPYKKVTASRGKRIRAEPVSTLYEQGRVHHVGTYDALEDQMCAFLPEGIDGPDDRVDALVWAATELFDGSDVSSAAVAPSDAYTVNRGSTYGGLGRR